MSRKISKILISLALVLMVGSALGQTPDSTRARTPRGSSDVVDLTGEAVRIKGEPERPRVNIIADRIKPEFENINLERSFIPELMGKGERIVILSQPESTDEIERIDIEQMLNKSR
jgi:hypothetical protein